MSTDALAEELKLVEEDLARRLQVTAAGLRRRIGDRDEEPTGTAERSALIETADWSKSTWTARPGSGEPGSRR